MQYEKGLYPLATVLACVGAALGACACANSPPAPRTSDVSDDHGTHSPPLSRGPAPEESPATSDAGVVTFDATAAVAADVKAEVAAPPRVVMNFDAGAVVNFDSTCQPNPQAGQPCSTSSQICRQADGNPCACINRKWVCATPCPAGAQTTYTFSQPVCDFAGQICRRPPPLPATEADICICGNHKTWDCVDLKTCPAYIATDKACPSNVVRYNQKITCQIPSTGGQSPYQICTCTPDTLKWLCEPLCPWGARPGGVCSAGSAACALLSLRPIVGGIWISRCSCGDQGTWGCAAAVRYWSMNVTL